MLRIAELTGDRFLRDVARAAIVGRYANFPGYHLNTARTTVYEKPHFPLRPVSQLNGVTSLHFNHIWPHIGLLVEYLVADVFERSDTEIDFPSTYCEGYAYVQGKVFGHAPGQFYGEQGVWLWMPKGLVDLQHVEVNYLAARSDEKLYLAFTNQSAERVTTAVRLNQALLPLSPRHTVKIWRDNRAADDFEMLDGQFDIEISPAGITAICIEHVPIQPRFQHRMHAASGSNEPTWKDAWHQQSVAGLTGMVISMGPELSSAYVYSRAELGKLASIELKYRIDDGPWQVAADESYPFEWTVPLSKVAKRFEYSASVIAADGAQERANSVVFDR